MCEFNGQPYSQPYEFAFLKSVLEMSLTAQADIRIMQAARTLMMQGPAKSGQALVDAALAMIDESERPKVTEEVKAKIISWGT